MTTGISPPPALTHTLRLAAATTLTLGFLGACSKPPAAAEPPRPVVAQPAQPQLAPHTWVLPGSVQARNSTPLSFRVPGKIIERTVRLGDSVRAGQVVAQLDPSDARKNAEAAKAQLSAAEHQFEFARQQRVRDEAQFKEDLIAAAQWEQTQNAYAAALAQRDQARQQATLASNQQSYTSLKADHAGVITAESADTGQNVAAGQPIYQLAWSGDVDVVSDIPENLLGQIAIGQKARVQATAIPGQTWQATLRELAPAADPQSRTYRAKFTVANPSASDTSASNALRLGMTAEISLQPDNAQKSATAPNFILPATALFHDGDATAVWVANPASSNKESSGTANKTDEKSDDYTLELRRVTVTHYGARNVTLSQGLQPGEVVVWQGVHTVSAGQKIRPIAPLHPEDFSL